MDKLGRLKSMITGWSIVSSHYIMQDRWLSLRSDRCRTESKGIVDPYYVLETKDTVHMVVLNDRYEVLLTSQYRHGAQIVSLEFPCGEIEANENPQEAMQRELLEETGYSARHFYPAGTFYSNPARQTNKVHTFLGVGARRVSSPQLDTTEYIKYDFFPISELKLFIEQGLFSQGLHIGSWYQAQHAAPADIRQQLV